MATNFDSGSILAQIPCVGGGILSLVSAQFDVTAADQLIVTQGTSGGGPGADGIINGATGNLDYAHTVVIASALSAPGPAFHVDGVATSACSLTTIVNNTGTTNSCGFRNMTNGQVLAAPGIAVQANATGIFILKN